MKIIPEKMTHLKYASQKFLYYFMGLSLILVAVQLVLLMVYGFEAYHHLMINLFIAELMLAAIGISYYIIPEECQQNIALSGLVYLHLGLVVILILWCSFFPQFSSWYTSFDLLVLLSFALMIFNFILTACRCQNPTIVGSVLTLGFILATWLYASITFQTYNSTNIPHWQQWAGRLWIDGVWELILGAILAFVLRKLTTIQKKYLDRWLYVVTAICLLMGMLEPDYPTGPFAKIPGIRYARDLLSIIGSCAFLSLIITAMRKDLLRVRTPRA
jgi:nitric oxide reductase subunit B